MGQLPKKYQAAFYATQKEVSAALRPYLARCCGQYFEKHSAIETFTVYSREIDDGDDRHRLRGIVTVWYGFPIDPKRESCSINVSFDSGMMGWHGNGDLDLILEKAIPPLQKAA